MHICWSKSGISQGSQRCSGPDQSRCRSLPRREALQTRLPFGFRPRCLGFQSSMLAAVLLSSFSWGYISPSLLEDRLTEHLLRVLHNARPRGSSDQQKTPPALPRELSQALNLSLRPTQNTAGSKWEGGREGCELSTAHLDL